MRHVPRIVLLALLLTAAPLTTSCAQSLYHPEHPEAVPDAGAQGTPPGATQSAPQEPAKTQAPRHRPAPAAKPDTPLVVPRGSVVLTPDAMPKHPGPSSRLRAGALSRCNEHQLECNAHCNQRTFGQARNLCYRQCKSQFDACAKRIDNRHP